MHCFQGFVLCHIIREVKNELKCLSLVLVVVIAIHIRFELIPNNSGMWPSRARGNSAGGGAAHTVRDLTPI
jgi:hypothetical protein